MKTYGEVEMWIYFFSTSEIVIEWSVYAPVTLPQGKAHTIPIGQEAG
jgi:hypothetical protein